MPLYEYECKGCDHRFETLQALNSSAEEIDCPSCGGEQVERLLSSFATVTATREPQMPSCALSGDCDGSCFGEN